MLSKYSEQRWFATAGDNSIEIANLKRALMDHAEGPVGQKGKKGCKPCKTANASLPIYTVRLDKRIPMIARYLKEIRENARVDRTSRSFVRYSRGRFSKRKLSIHFT